MNRLISNNFVPNIKIVITNHYFKNKKLDVNDS